MGIKRVVILVEDFKTLLKARIKPRELREIMLILNRMMAVQFVQEETRVSRQFGRVAVSGVVKIGLGKVEHLVHHLAKHAMPFEPKGGEAIEVWVPLPSGAGIGLGEHTQVRRQAFAAIKIERFHVARVAHRRADASGAFAHRMCVGAA